jgi:hypothetical protein
MPSASRVILDRREAAAPAEWEARCSSRIRMAGGCGAYARPFTPLAREEGTQNLRWQPIA